MSINDIKRLLDGIEAIKEAYSSTSAWENLKEGTFAKFRRGCLDVSKHVYILDNEENISNSDVKLCVTFLTYIAKFKFKRKHVSECCSILSRSRRWFDVLLHDKENLSSVIISDLHLLNNFNESYKNTQSDSAEQNVQSRKSSSSSIDNESQVITRMPSINQNASTVPIISDWILSDEANQTPKDERAFQKERNPKQYKPNPFRRKTDKRHATYNDKTEQATYNHKTDSNPFRRSSNQKVHSNPFRRDNLKTQEYRSVESYPRYVESYPRYVESYPRYYYDPGFANNQTAQYQPQESIYYQGDVTSEYYPYSSYDACQMKYYYSPYNDVKYQSPGAQSSSIASTYYPLNYKNYSSRRHL